jgi:hypothetical protein
MAQEQNILKNENNSNVIDVESSDLIDYELLSKLDSIKRQNKYKSFSEIYTGGIVALSKENRKRNPDWMSQSANSFREILYSLPKVENKQLQQVLTDYFKRNHTKEDAERYKSYLSELYKFFTDLAHHFSEIDNISDKTYKVGEGFIINANEISVEIYFDAVRLYKNYLKLLVITAVEIHRRIDTYINKGKKDKNTVKVFINNSYDAKSYFFSKIDKNWIHWLWTNSFFTDLKHANLDTEGNHEYCELEYLRRMAEEDPETVTKIIQAISVSINNSILIYHLIWIVSLLPAKQIKKLVDKIYDEKWISLLNAPYMIAYEFKDMIEKLISEEDTLSILKISTVKSKQNFAKNKLNFYNESPFVISHLRDSSIFEAISNIESNFLEEALKIACNIMTAILKLGEASKKESYDYTDVYSFYDIDIFSLDLEKISQNRRYRGDFLAFTATLKKLIERIFHKDTNILKVKKLFAYIDDLPSSNFSWRLKLFALAQCPKYLKKELKSTLFKLFEKTAAYDIGSEPEYQNTLKGCFSHLSTKDRRLYIQGIFKYYTQKLENNPEQTWHKDTAWEIMSCIASHLSLEEARKVETLFGRKCNKNYIPKPAIGEIRAGTVSHQSPEDLNQYTVPDIIKKLKTEWTPLLLKEKYKNDDFLKPRGAEGLSYALSADVKLRTAEYLQQINEFLNVEIDPRYLRAVLRGIEELLRSKQALTFSQARQLLNFFSDIANNDDFLKIPEQQRNEEYFPSLWTEANKICTDILIHLLVNNNIGEEISKSEADTIRKLILYWFTFSHSPIASEERQSPQELHGIAINSVKGRAYEAFVEFAHKHKVLSDEIKILFNKALSDESLAVRFCIGRYLSTFYYKDSCFIEGLLPHIFPFDNTHYFLAAFSGYLSTNLYLDLYELMYEYYSNAIGLTTEHHDNSNSLYPSFDELLATHLALAFAYANLKIGDNLFSQFWSNKNPVRHKEFISFIGQSCLNKEHISDEWLTKNNVSKEKLMQFWNWCLENISDAEALSGFGFWINPKVEVLDDNILVENIASTLKRSNGKLNWDHGFLQRLPTFAKVNSPKTLEAITYYLLDAEGNLNPNRHRPIYHDKEIKEALNIIYQSQDKQLKQKTIDLINSLIGQESQAFWDLEEIIDKET